MYKPCNLLLFCFSASTSLMGILRFSRYVALELKQTTINIDFPVTSPHATETVTTFEPRDWVQRSLWRQGAYLIEVHYKVKVQLILGLVSRNRRVPTFLRKKRRDVVRTGNAFDIKISWTFSVTLAGNGNHLDARCTDERWNVTFADFPSLFQRRSAWSVLCKATLCISSLRDPSLLEIINYHQAANFWVHRWERGVLITLYLLLLNSDFSQKF